MNKQKIKKLTYTHTMLLLKKLRCHDNYRLTVEPQYLRSGGHFFEAHALLTHCNIKVEFTLAPPKRRKRKQN